MLHFVGKPKGGGGGRLGRPSHNYEDNLKTDLRGIIYDTVSSSELAENGVKRRPSVITGIKLRVPNGGCFENTATASVEMVCSRTANWRAFVAPSDRKAATRVWKQWAPFMTAYTFRELTTCKELICNSLSFQITIRRLLCWHYKHKHLDGPLDVADYSCRKIILS
jgi:hypothetical protein